MNNLYIGGAIKILFGIARLLTAQLWISNGCFVESSARSLLLVDWQWSNIICVYCLQFIWSDLDFAQMFVD